ncbi:MAG: glycoside hydrolase family 32 protein [Anaerolineae bacterium]
MSIFFKPADAWSGDYIPFYWRGEYHLFYLKDYRDKDKHGEGTPWFHISTRDFVHFTDYGEALPRGTPAEQDLYVFTGCVFEHLGLFHIFYTGHNPHFREAGRPEQAVMHATSPDLIHWEKDPANPILFADPRTHERHDWRDPFVFWNEEAKEFWMLLAARTSRGPAGRRGVTALASSPDLTEWTIREDFWTPSLYYTHECPDLFRWGSWWYQVYSTFTERHITHYRLSRSLEGPWLAPTNDSFDGRAFYAAKTASDGNRRFAFGWDPTRTNESDTGQWNWGGNLVVHELHQQRDGSLLVKPPPEVLSQFTSPVTLKPEPRIGRWGEQNGALAVNVTGAFGWCRLGKMSSTCMIETTVRFTEDTRSCGLILRADHTLTEGYLIRLEPGRQRIVFERFPRPGDEPPIIERPLPLNSDTPVHLRVLVEGSVIVIYANDEVALSTRGYDHPAGDFGLFVSEGAASFSQYVMKSPA